MASKSLEVAVFGGGCFWCTEAVFLRVGGVETVTSGYAGGKMANPSYFQVSEEMTGHAEVVKLEFDPNIISYDKLLDIFWHIHDPTTLNQQGADVGTQYRSVILYTTEDQKHIAEATLAALKASNEFRAPIVTEIKPLETFYTAEEYHQHYFDRNENQPYCQVVIDPKIKKLLAKYGDVVKPEIAS